MDNTYKLLNDKHYVFSSQMISVLNHDMPLKEFLVLPRASVRNYRNDNLYNIFVRLLKGGVNSVFATSFYIEKLDNKGMYFVKLVA